MPEISPILLANASGLRVMSFNVNGIRAALRKGFADFLEETQPDIICLQEVKAHACDIPALPEPYTCTWHCANRKGYSGVGILSRVTLEQTVVGIGDDRFDSEGRVLRADFGKLSVLSVYVPSGSSREERHVFKMQFLETFYNHVQRLLTDGRELIICGDINIAHREVDLTNWRSNQKTSGFLPEERAWFSTFLDLGMVDAYRQHIGPDTRAYSWWSLRSGARSRDVGWRLDYQVTTPALAGHIRHAFIPITPVLSDHAPVILDYETKLSHPSLDTI